MAVDVDNGSDRQKVESSCISFANGVHSSGPKSPKLEILPVIV